jgi:ATP-dependent Lhr-like helicase
VDVLRRLRRASLAALRKEIEPTDRARLAAFLPSWQGVDRHTRAGAGIERLREALVPLQGLALPVAIWERDVLPRRTGAYSQTWLDALCASGEVVWVGAGPLGRSGRVALYFRADAPAIGPPPGGAGDSPASTVGEADHQLLRSRLALGPCFFSDLLAELDAPAEALREALWDLVWSGEVTNDAWAPLRAPRLPVLDGGELPRGQRALRGVDVAGRPLASAAGQPAARRSRFAARRTRAQRSEVGQQVQGRWSLVAPIFRDGSECVGGASASAERRRTLAELLLERYGIVTREQVLAERIPGGFALLYDTFANLETLGVCRRGYFVEGMGGAQFALPGAVERLRASGAGQAGGGRQADGGRREGRRTLVIAAADPAQPYGGALAWPKREGQERSGRPARVAGAYVVLVEDEPALYVERGGRGLLTLGRADGASMGVSPPGIAGAEQAEALREALTALAEAVRAGHVGRLAIERIDGQPAVASSAVAQTLVELGFQPGPRRFTLSA